MNRFSGLKVRTNELVGILWSFYSIFRFFGVIFEINNAFSECNLFYILEDHMAKFNYLKCDVL